MTVNLRIDLLERQAELEELDSRIESTLADSGTLLVVTGAAGVGKSRLLHEMRRRAQASGLRVLHARGHDREATSPYGVVRQLFDPIVARLGQVERRELFQGAARHARPILEDASQDAGETDPSTTRLHGLWWFLLRIAENEPLALVVDDLQWCDAESLQWLSFVARRSDSVAAALVVAMRTGDRPQDEQLIDEIVTQPHAGTLVLQPLGEASTGTVVSQMLGGDASDAVIRACHVATGGNPLQLIELLRALRAIPGGRTRVTADDVHRTAARTLTRLVERRLAALSTEAVMLARAAAVLGEGTPLDQAAEVAGLAEDAAEAAVRRLEDADILRPESRLQFVHPLVAEAVYRSMVPSERIEAHVQATVILRRRGAHVHRIAAQVLPIPAGRYADAIPVLRMAAADSIASGARASAVAYLRRVIEELMSDELRSEILYELGSVEMLYDGPAAADHLRQAAALLVDPSRRAEVALTLGPALSFTQRNAEAVQTYQKAMDELPADANQTLRQRLLAGLMAAAVDDSTLFPAVKEQAKACRVLTPEELDRPLASILAWHEARTGSPLERCVALAERGLGLEAGRDTAAIFAYGGLVLAVADRYDETRELCNGRVAYARASGSVFDFAIASWLRGIVAYLTGDLDGAEADQRQAIAAGEEHGLSAGLIYGYARLAEVLVDRGQLAEAESTLAQVVTPQPLPPLAHYDWWLFGRAQLRLAQERYPEALNDALEVGRRYESLDGVNPGFLSWRSTCALAHLGLKQERQAATMADDEVELARAWGGPRTLGKALRVAGITRRQNGLPLLAESLDVLTSSKAALELAQTMVDFGALQHSVGRLQEARKALWDGLELAQKCGAGPLTQRAHEALVLTGVRPRRLSRTGLSSLTPTERRVAALAATGLANRDVAEELFVTPKTIEMHLGNVYRKLQIQSRTQLGAALAESELPR